MALTYGISQLKSATIINPTMQGWSYRTRYTAEFVKNVLNVTHRYNRNVIFIAHEGLAEKSDEGHIVNIPILLGGQTQVQAPLRISEVWNVSEVGTKHRIAVRPCRSRKPMKTRMFHCGNEVEFDWDFDPQKWQGDTIEKWYNEWKANGYNKIPLPSSKKTQPSQQPKEIKK